MYEKFAQKNSCIPHVPVIKFFFFSNLRDLLSMELRLRTLSHNNVQTEGKLAVHTRVHTYCQFPFCLIIACCVTECAVGFPLVKDHANLKRGRSLRLVYVQLFPLCKLFTGTFLVLSTFTQHAMFKQS